MDGLLALFEDLTDINRSVAHWVRRLVDSIQRKFAFLLTEIVLANDVLIPNVKFDQVVFIVGINAKEIGI